MKSKTLNEFCRDHHITRQTAYREIHEGRLKTIKVGTCRRVPDIFENEWIAACAIRGQRVEPVDHLVLANTRRSAGAGTA